MEPIRTDFTPTSEKYGVVIHWARLYPFLGLEMINCSEAFPDCTMRTPGGAIIRIEIEYKSSNFSAHGHDLGGCDLVVCWIKNKEIGVPTIPISQLFDVNGEHYLGECHPNQDERIHNWCKFMELVLFDGLKGVTDGLNKEKNRILEKRENLLQQRITSTGAEIDTLRKRNILLREENNQLKMENATLNSDGAVQFLRDPGIEYVRDKINVEITVINQLIEEREYETIKFAKWRLKPLIEVYNKLVPSSLRMSLNP